MTRNNECTAVEAARRLNIELDYLYGLLWTGKLLGKKVNGRWIVSAEAIEARAKITRNEGDSHAATGR
jgi:hypothetical protein